jgi:aminoglycoside/choline kinase family phosphotransferase
MDNDILNKYVVRYINEHHYGLDVVPIAGDASGRRFYRVGKGGSGSVVVMDYGHPFQDLTDDIILTRIFQDAGLPVAGIVHQSPEGGFLVLDDLGEWTLEDHLAEPSGAGPELYAAAVELATRLADAGTAALDRSRRSRWPALDRERFRFEMEFFLEHYCCGLLDHFQDGTQTQPFRKLLLNLADRAAAVEPTVFCHRDYHSRNLIVSPAGRLSMVDIQDARRGPLGYDLASLLWDAYIDLDDDLRIEMIALFKEKSGPGPGFDEALEILALQRMLKVLGTFGYQISVLGRDRYRSAIPRTLENIRNLVEKMNDYSPIIDVLDQ